MILKYEDLNKIRQKHKNSIIGICTGSFDLFHYSHLMFLKYLKQNCDVLVVVVKSDKDVKVKGENRPIVNQIERAEIVDSVKYTDYTIISDNTHETSLIKKMIGKNKYNQKDEYRLLRDGSIFEKANANILFVTDDKMIPNVISDLCKEINIKIKIIPVQGNDFHTTDLINKIKNTN